MCADEKAGEDAFEAGVAPELGVGLERTRWRPQFYLS